MRRLAALLILPTLAALALVTGLLPSADARGVLGRIWPILAFLVAVTMLAELADEAGLFAVAAHRAAVLGRGRVLLLWLLVVVLASATTTLLSLDTTAVLLTPVVLSIAATLELPPVPFALTTVCLANTGSLLLPVANLTNLLAVDRLGWSAAAWATRMWLPALGAIAVTVAVLWLLYRRDLRGRYLRPPSPPEADGVLLTLAGLCCAGLGLGVALGVAPWVAAVIGTLLLGGGYLTRRPGHLTAGTVWRLVPGRLVLTTVSIFLVVATAERHGLAGVLAELAGHGGSGAAVDALRAAAVGALGSNVVNNLPAYLAVEPAVGTASPERLLGLVIGTDVGPLVTVWASLATLLWRERCRAAGLQIGAGRFAVVGLLVAPAAILVSAASLTVTTR